MFGNVKVSNHEQLAVESQTCGAVHIPNDGAQEARI